MNQKSKSKANKLLSGYVVFLLVATMFTGFLVINDTPVVSADWYGIAEFDYRKDIYIDSGQVNQTLKNFPVLIYIDNDADIGAVVQDDLDDLIFVNSQNDTQFNHEIESFNLSGGTLTAYIWVNVTDVYSDMDTHLNLYYGNSTISSTENPSGVWDSDFVIVSHMNDNTSSTVNDSTINDYHGTKGGGGCVETSSGIVGYGQDTDAELINWTTSALPLTNDYTYELWVNPDTQSGQYQVVSAYEDGANKFYWYVTQGTESYVIGEESNVIRIEYDYNHADFTPNNQWTYLATTADRDVAGGGEIYQNGTKTSNGDLDTMSASDVSPNVPLRTGGYWSGSAVGLDFDGQQDEFRVSNIARNESWLQATYNTIVNKTTFVTFGSQQEAPLNPNDFGQRMDLYVNSSQIQDDLVDFPVLVYIESNTSMYPELQSDLDDIAFFDTDNVTQLSHTIENYTYSGGEVSANIWVRIPSISSSVDTHFSMVWNNSDCSNQQDVNGTWDSNYTSVFLFEDLNDSTSNGLTLSNNGATQVPSLIGSGYDFENSENDYMEETTLLKGTETQFYIECWVKKESAEAGGYYTITMRDDGNDAMQVTITGSATELGYAWVKAGGNSEDAQGSITVGVDEWHYLGTMYVDDEDLVYQITDGRIVTDTLTGTYSGSSYDFNIGAWDGETVNDYDGIVCSVRTSNIKRNSSWIRATYNTVNNRTGDNSFIIFPSETPPVTPSISLDGFNNRTDLWINSSQVDEDLTNFPVLVYFENDTDLFNNTQAGGIDLLFTDTSNNTWLNFEIDYWNESGSSVTAVIWVNMSISSSTDTHFNMWTNNSNVTDNSLQNVTDVWDSNYLAVYHGNDQYDSSINNYTLTEHNGVTTSESDIGVGYLFDGNDDYLSQATLLCTMPSAVTYETWVMHDSVTAGEQIIRSENDHSEDALILNYQISGIGVLSTNTESGGTGATQGYATNGFYSDIYYFCGLTWSANDYTYGFFDDEIFQSAGTTSQIEDCGSGTPAYDIQFGASRDSPGKWEGIMDELRISQIERNSSWMFASYNTINNKTGDNPFVILSFEEPPPPTPAQPDTPPSIETNLNETYEQPIDLNFTAWFNDSEGDIVFNYMNSSTGEQWSVNSSNITGYIQFSSLPFYSKIWVNCSSSDGNNETLTSFWFYTVNETVEITAPVVTTNETEGIEETNATLNGYLVDDGGENCTVGFEYGTTDSYGNTLYDSYTAFAMPSGSGGGGFSFGGAFGWRGQTFTVGSEDIKLHGVAPYISSPSGTITASIRETDGSGLPTGDDLVSKSQSGSHYFYFDNVITLNASTKYSVVLTSGTLNTVTGKYNGYGSGDMVKSTDGGSTWSKETGWDIYDFFIYAHNEYGSDNETNIDLTGLTEGQLYHYRTLADNSNGTGYGNDSAFLTKPDAPTGINLDNSIDDTINISWTKGTGSNNTIIERNTSENWERGEGIEVYNGTDSYYLDGGLTEGTTYYYQIWGYTEWSYNPLLTQYSSGNASASSTVVNVPVVQTNSSDEEETYTYLIGFVSYTSNTSCETWFEYGTTEALGNTQYPRPDLYPPENYNDDTGYEAPIGGYYNGTLDYRDGSFGNTHDEDGSTYFRFDGDTGLEGYLIWNLSEDKWIHGFSMRGYEFNFDEIAIRNTSGLWEVVWTGSEDTGSNLIYLYANFTGVLGDGLRIHTTTPSLGVIYGIYESRIRTSPNASSFEFRNLLGSLSEGQLYYYRAVANNSVGTSYGSNLTFLTKPDEPTGIVVTDLEIGDSINISWTLGTGANNTIVERNQTGSTVWGMGEGIEIYNGTDNYFVDTGLLRGTTYYYQIWSYTEWSYNPTLYQYSDNNDSDSGIVSFNPDAPSSFTGVKIDSQSINLTWNKPFGSDKTTIYYKEGIVAPTGVGDGTLGYNDTSSAIDIIGLNEGTYYTFGAWTWNETVGIHSGNWTNVTTNTNFKVNISNENPANNSVDQEPNFIWNFTQTEYEGELMTMYIDCSNGQSNQTIFIIGHPSRYNGSMNLTLTNLDYSTTYTVWVNVTDGIEYTREWFYFTTRDEYVPSIVTNLSVERVNDTIINLSWDKTNDVDYSYIRFKIGSAPSTMVDGTYLANITGTTFSHTNLNQGTNYYYSIWSYNVTDNVFNSTYVSGDNWTNPGEPTSFTNLTPSRIIIPLEWVNGINATHTVVIMNETGYAGYPTTLTNGTEITNTTGSNYDASGLSDNTTYYFSIWGYNDSANLYSILYSSLNATTLTDAFVPSDFTAERINDTVIILNWTKGQVDEDTVIRRDTSGYPSLINGTEIYNGSLSTYSDTGLTPSVRYYYTAWGWNGLYYSLFNVTSFNDTLPQSPQNLTSNIWNSTQLNLSWDKGIGASHTLIKLSTGSYPTLDTGTIIYNDTDSSYNYPSVTANDLIRAWSYNDTYNLYSSSVDLIWGGLEINVYKESELDVVIENFTVFITNTEGTETYEATNLNNPFRLNVEDVPNGEDIAVQVSKDGYYTRVKYLDLFENIWYVENFYLAPDVGGGGDPGGGDYIPPQDDPDGDNESYGYLYLITVVNQYDEPVEDAKLDFRRYNNVTEEFDSVSILYTDSAGQVSLYLLSDNLYKIYITHPGYQDEISDWIPGTEIFTHTFRLDYLEDEGTPIEGLFDGITWSISPHTYYHNGSFEFCLTVNSAYNQLEWFRFTVEYYNDTNSAWVLINETNESSLPGGGSICYTVENTTGKYRISTFFKKENFSEYEFDQTGSTFYFISWGGLFTNPVIGAIPGWLFLAILIIIMALVMAFAFPYAGIGTGYIGMGIFALGLLIKPDVVAGGVEGWVIFALTFIIYSVALFLWSRI